MPVTDLEGSFERNLSLAYTSQTSDCYPLTVPFKFLRSECRNDLLKLLFSADEFAVLAKGNTPMPFLVD